MMELSRVPDSYPRSTKGEEMASAQEHRRNAAECVRIAKQTQDPNAKALLLTMADSWLKLAQEQEAKDSKEAKKP
jgi:hypothetical protein